MAVEVPRKLGPALAHCLTVMSNPIATLVTRTASTVTSPQATRPWLSNSHTSPADTASTDFHAVLSREDATNSPIGNNSSVLMVKVPPNPTSPLQSLPNDPSLTASTAITDTSGRKEMPGTAKTTSELVDDADRLAQGNRTSNEDGSTTLGTIQLPPYAAPGQTMPAQSGIRPSLTAKPAAPVATSKDPAHDAELSTKHGAISAQIPQQALQAVLVQVEPVQADVQASPTPPQPASDHVEPELLASASNDAPVTTTSSGSGDVKPSSSRPGHARAGAHSDTGASSIAPDQEGQQPGPTMITQVVPGALASGTVSPLESTATSSSRLMTSTLSTGSEGSRGVRPTGEISVESPSDEAGADASLPVTGSPATSSALAQSPAAFPLPSTFGVSGTTSSATGKSPVQDLAQPVLRRPDDDAGAHPSSKMTTIVASGEDPVAALTVAGTPTVDPAAPLAPAVLLPVKPVDPYMSNASGHTATSQVAPAVISLATRTDGSNEITVSLNPRDLGQVEVHLIRGSDGTTSVSITASNPETLQELSQNVHHLHAALDAANIPVDGRNLSFNATPAAATGQGQGDPTGRGAATAHDGSNGGSGGQDPGQGRAWQQNRATRSDSNDNDTYIPPAPLATRKSWQLSGLNITA